MCGSLLIGALARPWARQAMGFVLTALTLTLFILNLRRSAERAGREGPGGHPAACCTEVVRRAYVLVAG